MRGRTGMHKLWRSLKQGHRRLHLKRLVRLKERLEVRMKDEDCATGKYNDFAIESTRMGASL